MSSRLKEVEEAQRSGILLLGEGDPEVAAFVGARQAGTSFDIWVCTKEIIYRRGDSGRELHFLLYLLDASTLELVCTPALYSRELSDEHVLYGLAMAILHRIPVYPDTQDEEEELANWHERLLREGFKTEVDGQGLHFLMGPKLTGKPSDDPLDWLSTARMVSPAELLMVRGRLAQRLAELSAAQSILDRLDFAIESLQRVLNTDSRNENAIQRCITENPILFGPEYRRLLPKHKLGAEYVLDYALELTTGLVDIVELESSTLDLYGKAGDPRSELVHAEQQVLDYFEWMQAHGAYAREKLPGIHRPRGFVVIGRRASLGKAALKKLKQRNRVLGEFFTILTYDDLLDRARNLRQLLTQQPDVGAPKKLT